MKQFLVSLSAIIVLITSCSKDNLVGNGNTATEIRTVTGFSQIEVDGTTDVTVTQGSNFKVEVTAYNNLLPQLETKVIGNVLKIGYKSGTSIMNDNSEVHITLPVLSKFSSTGNSNVIIQNGATVNFEAIVTGASTIKAFGFTAQQAHVKVEGSGSVELSVTNELHARIIGSGNIYYKGNPSSVTTDITGSGKVEKR
jgi:hypothetical protein